MGYLLLSLSLCTFKLLNTPGTIQISWAQNQNKIKTFVNLIISFYDLISPRLGKMQKNIFLMAGPISGGGGIFFILVLYMREYGSFSAQIGGDKKKSKSVSDYFKIKIK